MRDTLRDGGDNSALHDLTHERRVANVVVTYQPIRVVQFEGQGWITLDNRVRSAMREAEKRS